MEAIMNVINFGIANWQVVLGAVATVFIAIVALLKLLIMLFLLIPGPHPEDWMQSVVDKLQVYADWLQSKSKK